MSVSYKVDPTLTLSRQIPLTEVHLREMKIHRQTKPVREIHGGFICKHIKQETAQMDA